MVNLKCQILISHRSEGCFKNSHYSLKLALSDFEQLSHGKLARSINKYIVATAGGSLPFLIVIGHGCIAISRYINHY